MLKLGSSASGASALVQEIYANASSFIKKTTTLNKLVREIWGSRTSRPIHLSLLIRHFLVAYSGTTGSPQLEDPVCP
jgi:hypothetical protein